MTTSLSRAQRRRRRPHLGRAVVGVLAVGALAASTLMATSATAVQPDDSGERQPRIVGGSTADPAQHPWQVLLEPNGFLCGGSVVHPRLVLTAAHCVTDDDGGVFPAETIGAYLGRRNADSGGLTLDVQGVHVAPGYDPVTVADDYALLTLGSPVPSSSVIKIAGAGEEALWASGRQATVSGFGATSEGGPSSPVLKQVTLPLRPDGDCSSVYGDYDVDRMLCSGAFQLGQDSCQGDSGGPLTVTSTQGRRLVGVVSYGNGCGAGDPGVYVKIGSGVVRSALTQLAEEAATDGGFGGADLGLFGSGAQVPDAASECEDAETAFAAAKAAYDRALAVTGVTRQAVATRTRNVRALVNRGAPRSRIANARRLLAAAKARHATASRAAGQARSTAVAAALAVDEACD